MLLRRLLRRFELVFVSLSALQEQFAKGYDAYEGVFMIFALLLGALYPSTA
jgi:drug/metabolite transporter superfamily protein YnfA